MFAGFPLLATTHICYLLISIGVVVWVARILRIRGRVFLAKGSKGNDELTESLSHLFSVGFYLLHVGLVLLALRAGGNAVDVVSAIELLSTKVGLVLVVLAISHFTHFAIYARIHGKPHPAGHHDYVGTAELVRS